jgi:hypothetical protein
MITKGNFPDLAGYALSRAPMSADHAEDVLEFFCDDVDNLAFDGPGPDRRILLYLANCFRDILAGVDPKEALNLDKRAEGQRRRRTLEKIGERDLKMAIDVARRMHHGQLREDAFAVVAEHFGMKRSAVRNAYEEYSKAIKKFGWDK